MLKPTREILLLTSAFKVNLRRYTVGGIHMVGHSVAGLGVLFLPAHIRSTGVLWGRAQRYAGMARQK
jgi:hypothetical protein